ncbi:MAG: hypothetical protein AAB462_01515 [Patescibacteria group bacterium]
MSSPTRLRSVALDLLPNDVLSLGVPILNGAIQVENYHDKWEKGRIQLKTTRDMAKIALEGGQKFEIDVYRSDTGGPVEDPNKAVKVRALSQPISELVLVRMDFGDWLVSDSGLQVEDHDALQTFINEVGERAHTKHNSNNIAALDD